MVMTLRLGQEVSYLNLFLNTAALNDLTPLQLVRENTKYFTCTNSLHSNNFPRL